MVNWVVQNKNGDVNRVYVAGHSSGGMMTNVLLGSYPDVFKAGAAFAGVPFACFAQGSVDSLGWNTSCATGKVTKTGTQWGELVKAAYPGFSGARPRMQLWHGTKDDVIYFQNFKEEIKQWTNVLGVSETPTATENNAIQGSWIRTRYANTLGMVQVEAIEETDQPHNLVVDAAAAIHFFGLDGSYEVPDAGVKDSGTSAKAGSGSSAGVGAIGSGGFSVVGSAGFAGRLGSTGNTSGVGGGAFGGAGSNSIVVTVSNGGTTVTATAAGAGSGGSITPGQNPSGSKSSGCSCHTGAGGSVPSGGFWMISLLLGLGFYRRSQQRYSSDSSNKAIP
jgi:MYXO-CTERM domain-containing protein